MAPISAKSQKVNVFSLYRHNLYGLPVRCNRPEGISIRPESKQYIERHGCIVIEAMGRKKNALKFLFLLLDRLCANIIHDLLIGRYLLAGHL